jgi:FAD synthetase
MRMAEVPEGAEVIAIEGMAFPPIVVRNVYIFPGIPELLRRKFEAIRDRFRDRPFLIRRVYVRAEECLIADHLTEVDAAFPDVQIGSYPRIDTPEYKVVVSLESPSAERLDEAFARVVARLPEGSIVRIE